MRRFSPASAALAGAAIVCSAGLHLVGLAQFEEPARSRIAGGASAVVAIQGTSFADMVQGGVSQPAAAASARMPEPEKARGSEPVIEGVSVSQTTDRAAHAAYDLAAEVRIGEAPAARTAASSAVPVASRAIASDVVTSLAPSDAPLAEVPSSGATSQPDTRQAARTGPPPPTSRSTPGEVPAASALARAVAPTLERLENVPDGEQGSTTPRVSLRPSKRPPSVENRAAAALAEEVRRAPSPQPAGNAQTTARRGTAGGATAARATSSGSGTTQQAGNAKSSNYKGRLQTCVARAAQRASAGRSTTVSITFTVNASGRIGSVSASGDARTARAVSRAVAGTRCPAPPGGISTPGSVNVRVR